MNLSSATKNPNPGRLVFITIAILANTLCFAAPSKTVYSIGNPASVTTGTHWSLTSGGASCGCTPDFSKDIIHIETNTTSSINIDVKNGAELYISNNATFSTSEDVTFRNGSIVNIAVGSTFSISGSVENKNNSNQIVVNGTLTMTQSFQGGNGSAITTSGTGVFHSGNQAQLSGTGSIFGSTTSCNTGPCNASNGSPLPVR
ncbi:MAG: hypothetical protein NT150_13815, partial [Bacteroidetes bacterium]|nr:hypothetical protein [Bacteroidota bacterium]